MNGEENWLRDEVIGISVSESEDLLAHGFGREHLREFLVRLARRLLRAGADLAYGGHFRRRGSFTRDLIERISDEQREGIGDSRPWIGKLYNHSHWPHYLDISDDDEADFVDACRFVRITQDIAGIPADQQIADPAEPLAAELQLAAPADPPIADTGEPPAAERLRLIRAVVASRMRQAMAEGLVLPDPRGRDETIPAVACRVLVAGKTSGFSGILPGLFEEALTCFEAGKPLFLIGAYGGAGGRLAGYVAGQLPADRACLDMQVLRVGTPALAALEGDFRKFPWAASVRRPAAALQALLRYLDAARKDIPGTLRNGLDRAENLRLFANSDTAEAAELVLRGLARLHGRDGGGHGRGGRARRKSGVKGARKRKPKA